MKVLVFAPHSAIWIHAFPEALVAESLRQGGHQVVYATCGTLFREMCIPMSAAGVRYDASAEEKSKVCRKCTRNAAVLRREFGFAGPQLEAELLAEDRAAVDEFFARLSRDNFSSIEFLGIPVGQFALYQFLILRKRIGLDFTADEWDEYLHHLRTTVLAAAAVQRILEREKPDRVLLYNGLYSVNAVCRALAARQGALSYFLHAGGSLARRLQALMLGRDHTFRYYPSQMAHWPQYRDLPISAAQMRPTTDHFAELLRGRSVFAYSAGKSEEPFDLRRRFSIGAGQKVLVATMSSYDEEFAAEVAGARVYSGQPLFATQADWIRCLLEFVAERPDLYLIVRVHPREFPNRREGVKSEHATLLEGMLFRLPANATVNWPADRISLYDLAEEADVFLNSWSSVGKEMCMLGKPVVTYATEVIFYPSDLNYFGATIDEYLLQIDRALADGWSAERIRMVYRWTAIELGRGLIDIGDSYAQREHQSISLPRRVAAKARRMIDPEFTQRRDCRLRQPQLAAAGMINRIVESGSETVLDILDPPQTPVTLEEESSALRGEIRRLMAALYPASQGIRTGTLRANLRALCEAA